MDKITPKMLVKDILAGFETDSGIILGIAPQHKSTLEILMVKSIEAWEKIKFLKEKEVQNETR